ncbi:MAG TPA: hypothetical protein VKZ49_08485 [Polyangiaceae bacterium]|nr:hypothetical protein [Polyangiaceae bacterium]
MRLLVVLGSLSMIACGHPATVEECERIVERVAELELRRQFPDDPERVKQEIEATKKEKREAMMRDCVGKRVTSRAMQCVNEAESAEQIVEECFD